MPCPDLVRVLGPDLVPLVTHFTQAALAALVHLLDAWNVADNRNRPHVVTSIAGVLETLNAPTSQPLAWFVVVARLSSHGARQLVDDLEVYEQAWRGRLHPANYWRQQLGQAAVNAPKYLGVFLCCGRRIAIEGVPGRHLGGAACSELGQ